MGVKRRSEIDKRLKRITRELRSVDTNLHTLERTVTRETGAKRSSVLKTPAPAPTLDDEARGRRGGRDSKFADFLSSSLEPVRPLRRERRIQRNKVIVMTVFVLLVLFWVLHRLFL
jgi:hypothetical protein